MTPKVPAAVSARQTETRIQIRSDVDIVAARQKGRAMAVTSDLAPAEATLIATAISELARNIVVYAKEGEVVLQVVENNGRRGIRIVADDNGPGIADVELAMQLGYSTSGSLGLGLPGVKRLMDEFEIASEPGSGTRVTVVKWRL